MDKSRALVVAHRVIEQSVFFETFVRSFDFAQDDKQGEALFPHPTALLRLRMTEEALALSLRDLG